MVLDDALHYLQDRGLSGIHNTKSNTQGKPRLTNGDSGQDHQTNGVKVDGYETSHSKNLSLLFPLSAADEDGISRMATALGDHLLRREAISFDYLRDLSFTLSDKRELLPWKGYAVGSSVQELRESLDKLPRRPIRITQTPEVYFAFTGQGAQWANMGVELMDRYQVFQDAMNFANEYFRSLGSQWSLFGTSRNAIHMYPANRLKTNCKQPRLYPRLTALSWRNHFAPQYRLHYSTY